MKTPLNISVIAVVVAGVIALIGAKMFGVDQYHTSERIEWKDSAIAELSFVEPAKGIPPFKFIHDEWFSPQGLLMKDGSWIAYRQICHKEKPKVYDIFVGRGSNGKWYYSTYHFCIGAVTIMDEQPNSLSSFIEQCALVEFDGESGDCLLPTWPPEK